MCIALYEQLTFNRTFMHRGVAKHGTQSRQARQAPEATRE